MKNKTCAVIIPALNEEKTIGDIMQRIPKVVCGNVRTVTIVVDDGSADATAQIALSCGGIVVSNGTNQGVGFSFNRGVMKALELNADYAVNIDADGQMNPEDIERILAPIVNGEADMVTASRFIDKDLVPVMPKVKRWGNARVADIVSFICRKRYYDVSCGFRAYSRDVLLRMNLHGKYTYTQETFINLATKDDIRILEIPVTIRGEREFGKSRVASSVLKYARKSGAIMLRAMKDYRPELLFGGVAGLNFVIALILEIIFLIHYLNTGLFSGYLWAGITGGFFLIVALFSLLFMIISDSISRVILNQEKLLYYEKKKAYESNVLNDDKEVS